MLQKWQIHFGAAILVCVIGMVFSVYGQDSEAAQKAIAENNQVMREFFAQYPAGEWGEFREVQAFWDRKPPVIDRNRTRPSEMRAAQRGRNRGYQAARDIDRASRQGAGEVAGAIGRVTRNVPVVGTLGRMAGIYIGGTIIRKGGDYADQTANAADRAYEDATDNNYIVKKYTVLYRLFFANLSEPVDVYLDYLVKVHKSRYSGSETRSILNTANNQWQEMGLDWKTEFRRLSLNDALAPFKGNTNVQ